MLGMTPACASFTGRLRRHHPVQLLLPPPVRCLQRLQYAGDLSCWQGFELLPPFLEALHVESRFQGRTCPPTASARPVSAGKLRRRVYIYGPVGFRLRSWVLPLAHTFRARPVFADDVFKRGEEEVENLAAADGDRIFLPSAQFTSMPDYALTTYWPDEVARI